MEPSAGTAPSMGPVAKLVNVLFSPSKVFEAVAARPGWDWLLPIAIMLVVAFAVSTVTSSRIDVDEAVRAQMKQMERRLEGAGDAQREQTENAVRGQFKFFLSPVGRLVSMAFLLLPIVVVPAIYKGIAAAFGKGGGYVAILAGYAWCRVPDILYWILNGVVALPRDKLDVQDLQSYRMVKSNLGAFLDPETSRGILAVASNLDVFAIWGVALAAIMLSKTTKLSPKGAAIAAVSLWVVWVLLQAGLAALGAAFGG